MRLVPTITMQTTYAGVHAWKKKSVIQGLLRIRSVWTLEESTRFTDDISLENPNLTKCAFASTTPHPDLCGHHSPAGCSISCLLQATSTASPLPSDQVSLEAPPEQTAASVLPSLCFITAGKGGLARAMGAG